jgi:hypothetical protein
MCAHSGSSALLVSFGQLTANCGWDHHARVQARQQIELFDSCQSAMRGPVSATIIGHRAALTSSFSSSGG